MERSESVSPKDYSKVSSHLLHSTPITLIHPCSHTINREIDELQATIKKWFISFQEEIYNTLYDEIMLVFDTIDHIKASNPDYKPARIDTMDSIIKVNDVNGYAVYEIFPNVDEAKAFQKQQKKRKQHTKQNQQQQQRGEGSSGQFFIVFV
jgi:hypothetical protein